MRIGNLASAWSTCGSLTLALFTLLLALAPAGLQAADLGEGELRIAGTRLVVEPAHQTVPFDTPTLVETTLRGYDVTEGSLPANIRVAAELSGPEISGVLKLETLPNEPFRIPRLRLKGTYELQNIRLVQDDQLLAYAEPRTATVEVTRILVTSVSAQAMSEDEMRSYGIVVGDDSFQAFNLTFGFGLKTGEFRRYALPVVYRLYGSGGEDGAAEPQLTIPAVRNNNRTASPRFQPPNLAPFKIDLEPEVREQVLVPKGGCDLDKVPCRQERPPAPPMVGVIMFPSDVSLLHQFFSVVLMVQNGAPEGDVLTVRDLTAKARLPAGLRAAETDPPTPLGVPVPVRAPGPDGEVGTADDLRLLVAQASGEAEFLVEGLREGSHIVEFDLQGVLEGMPGGARPITGKARGAVVVRDPTLSVSLAHPEVVRTDELFTLSVTLTNLGNAPVNGIDFNLPSSGLAGVELAPGQNPTESLGSLLPGEASTVEFQLLPHITGRVIAASAKSGSALQPRFEFDVGISNGVPLSPLSLAMPSLIHELPSALRKEAIGLLGLGHSLSTAGPGVAAEAPRVQRQTVHERVYKLVQAARHLSLGEDEFDAMALLATEWLGSRDDSWEWDRMRRSTDRGLALTVEQAEILAQRSTLSAFERFAEVTHYLRPQLVAASGAGVRLELQSRASGRRSDDGAGARELPFVDLYPLDDGSLALAATPESDGYRAIVRRDTSGSFALRVLLPRDEHQGMRVLSWNSTSLGPDGEAWVDFDLTHEAPVLYIDDDGDSFPDRSLLPVLTALDPRPFEVVAAIQNKDLDPSGHVVEVLFSSALELESLVPRQASRFTLPGKVSNGGVTPVEDNIGGDTVGETGNPFFGLFNPRIVRVVFNNPISPLVEPAEHLMTVDDVRDVSGREISNFALPVTVTVDQPGIKVTGQVIDPYGQALPYAEVGLWEWDRNGVEGETAECKRHRTAAVIADADGRFEFDYVRQTACSDRFELRAESSAGPHRGRAYGKVRFAGSTQELDIIMVGRAIVKGRVVYDDGTVPAGLQVFAHNPVFDVGRRAWVDEEGNFRMAEVAVGTVTLWAQDGAGNRVFQTIEVPTAGAEVVRDLVMLRRPEATTARLNGRAVDVETGDPEQNAYVALYVDGARVNVARTDAEGQFDFGVVPTGVAEIEAFDGATGRRGTQLFFELAADDVKYVELELRDERGSLEGFVRRRLVDGTVVPVAGAVVWAEGTPFNTTTDEQGHYVLEDVFPGNRRLRAADLEANEVTDVYATVSAGVTQTADLYFEDDLEVQGGLFGTVRDANNQVVEGATVHLGGSYWSTRWSYEARTDAEGRFHIPDLPPGVYGVHAYSGYQGGVTFAEIRFPGDTDHVTVRLLSGKIRGRTFVRDESGQVQGVPSLITYRHVEVISQWGLVVVAPDFSYAETDGDGYFEIEALHGPYELFFYNPFQETGYRKVSGTLGPIEPDHQIEFKKNGSISGTVVLEDGVTPAPGARVELRGGPFSEYDLETDEDGRFTFELVPPGRYHVTVIHDQGVIFRQERVYVNMRRHGAKMEIDVRLQAQGRVEGYVIDADDQFVPGAVVELRERGFPWRRLVQNADENGQFSFENIFEGEMTLRARAPALGGLAGHECLELTSEGELLQAEIRLEGTGDLRGQIVHPETGAGVPNARVSVSSGLAFVDSTQTDADGYYEIRDLKLRSYRVRVFDPATGRRGLGPVFAINTHGQDEVQDVVLEVRGVVQGHLYDPDAGNQPVPGATLQLHSQGIRWFKTYSSTGIEGEYSFEGIPEGDFDISTYQRRRRARASGRIVEEDQVVELDIYFERQGRIFGRVFGPKRFAGDPGELVTNVNTLVRFNSPLAATTENPFDLDGLPPRATLTLEAREINGDHLADYHFKLRQGEDHEVDVQLRAIGSARIRTLSSTGQPVSGVQVRLRNSYSHRTEAPTNAELNLRRRDFNASTGDDHEVVFEGVRQGHLDVRIEDPVSGLKGRRRALLRYEDEEVLVEVSLQPSGWVRGQVLLSDGLTPAASAIVALDAENRAWQLAEADEEGRFEFDAVPLGPYELIAQQADGPGTYRLTSQLDADQEEDDFTLVLDDDDPFVVSVDPPLGSRDTSRTLDVVVTFSEPMGLCGACRGAYLQQISNSQVASFNRIWSADRTQLILRPAEPLRNDTGYKLVVDDDEFRDTAGRQLAWRVVSSFYTADTVPPAVIDIRPRQDAVQVPVDAGLEVTFSEPLDIGSLSGAFTVTDLTAGQTLTTTTITTLDDRRVILTPVSSFGTDRQIEVRVVGVADGSGNAMTEPFIWRFWTPDATPPEITWTAPSSGQAYTAGDTIDVSADITDNRGVARVVFSLRDWSQELHEAPFEWRIPAPVMEQAGPVEISVHVTDIFGNEAASTREVFVEPLDNAVPPALAVGCPVDGDLVAPGLPQPVTFQVSDDLAVESAWLLIDGARVDRHTPVNSESADIELVFTPPAEATPGQNFQAMLEARDFAGNIVSVPLTFAVPMAEVLAGDQVLTTGAAAALAAGTYTLEESATRGELTLLHGALLTAAPGTQLSAPELRLQCGAQARLDRVDLSGDLIVESKAVLGPQRLGGLNVTAAGITIETGAQIDGTNRGYFGQPGAFGSGGSPWFPAGRTSPEGGGSHGGLGVSSSTDGEPFGSVYVPNMHGSGGRNNRRTHPSPGGDGGGLVAFEASGTLTLDGIIDVSGGPGRGEPPSGAGAGGSVRLVAQHLEGIGRVVASGGEQTLDVAGGGRVAIAATTLDFDPASQVENEGGRNHVNVGQVGSLLAGPGTTLVETGDSIYGTLIVDGGEPWPAEIDEIRPAALARLGQLEVVATQAQAQDLWLFTGADHLEAWLGAFARLQDAGGGALGTFRVLEVNEDRLRLGNASGVAGTPATVQGVYRFDRIELRHSRLLAEDPVEVVHLTLEGDAVMNSDLDVFSLTVAPQANVLLGGELRAQTLTIGEGAVLAPDGRHDLTIDVAGVMTVAAGAVIHADGRGHEPGDAASGLRGYAPADVLGSRDGGSHGGLGFAGSDAGEAFGSVYRPQQRGGGGGAIQGQFGVVHRGGLGGGLVTIRAGELVLEGTVRANGWAGGEGHRGGAGGTVFIETARLSGAGNLEARGAGQEISAGGGGRIAVLAQDMTSFDPTVQASARGGLERRFSEDRSRGGAGTIFVKTAASTYGDLLVDAEEAAGLPVGSTPLVAFGEWVVGAVEVDAAEALNLWIEPQDAAVQLGFGVEGMWARVNSIDFRVLAEAGDRRRVLLEGAAGAVQPGDSVSGVYKFDQVSLHGGARVVATDVFEADAVETAGDSTLDAPTVAQVFEVAGGAVVLAEQPIRAGTVIVRSGGELRAVQGTTLRIEADQVTIEAGGVISADGAGYPGGVGGFNPPQRGGVPDGLVGSREGGAHGGHGDGSSGSTETYGSLYRPRLGGGGGASLDRGINANWAGGPGGGVVEIIAQNLVIDGVVRSNGLPGSQQVRAGAGGSLYLEADSIAGSGGLEARGAAADRDGGGGRIALIATDLLLDVAQQVRVDSAGGGGPGTVYVRHGSSTWGDLHIDAHAPGTTVQTTALPRIDENEVATIEVDAEDPGDLWVETVKSGSDPSVGVEGMHAMVDGIAYRVLAEDGRGRFLLEGAAGAVQAGDMLEGLHRFDNVYVRRGARVTSGDAVEAAAWHVDSDTTLTVDTIGPGAANCGSGNLLQNPGGDEPEISGPDGRIPGWIQLSGDWTDGDPGWSAIGAIDGPDYLWPGHASSAELYQDIDLSLWSGEIDAGYGYAFFAGSLRSPADDPARFRVDYLDSAGLVLDAYDTGEVLHSQWARYTDHRAIPPQARTARIRLLARRDPPGTHLSAVFDAMRFHVLPAPTLQVGGDTSVAETAAQASYLVSLTCPRTESVTASYQAVAVTAQADADFAATEGTVIFAPGETQKTLTVPLLDDQIAEGSETFRFEVSTLDLGGLTASLTTTLSDDELAGLAVQLTDAYPGLGLYPGAAVDYTATVTFAGSSALTNIRLSALMAAELAIDAGTVSTSVGSVTSTSPLVIDVGSLVPGTTFTVGFTAHLTSYPAADTVDAQLVLSGDGLQDLLSDDPATVAVHDATTTPVSAAPENLQVTLSGSGEGAPAHLVASFEDPTAGDSFSATVDWGDGTTTSAAVTAGSQGGTVQAVHTYGDGGSYPLNVCITDAAGAETCHGENVTVEHVAPSLGAIDFNDWTIENYPGAAPDWRISTDSRRLTQWVSTNASVAYSDFQAMGSRIKGRLRMEGDNDYVGFVVGFEPGDSVNPEADYLLVTWKGVAESGAPVGLRVYRISGVITDPWRLNNDSAAQILDYGNTMGSSAWVKNSDQRFELESTAEHFRLWLGENLELEVTAPSGGALPVGRFGFYVHGQSSALFTEWSREVVDPPVDHAALPLRQLVTSHDWTGEDLDTSSSSASCDWLVATSGLNFRTQGHCRTGVFLSPDDLGFSRTYAIMRFQGTYGLAGPAFGLEPGEVADPDADYLLVSWNRNSDSRGPRGLRLWRIRGQFAGFQAANAELLAVGQTYGSSAWARFRWYQVTTHYEPDRFRLWIDGELEIDVAAPPGEPFTEGRYGLVASGYPKVIYGAIERWGLTVTEGDTTPPLVAAFTDPGTADTHSASVDWGDGVPVAGSVTQGAGHGQVTLAAHTFEDDQGSVELCVTGDDGGSGCVVMPVRSLNAAPLVDAGSALNGDVGSAVSLAGASFTDPGLADTHTATVDWGDGTEEALTLTQSAGSGTLSGTHTYAAEGVYSVTLCVTDDDGGTGCSSVPATVVGTSGSPASVTAADTEVVCVDDGAASPCETTLTVNDNEPAAAQPGLRLSKTVALSQDRDGDGRVSAGDELRYDLAVENVGSGVATGVIVSDSQPVHTRLVPGSLTASAGSVFEGAFWQVVLGEMPAGAEPVKISFKVDIDAALRAGIDRISNQASLTSTEQVRVLSDDPFLVGAADATVLLVGRAPRLALTLAAALSDSDGDGLASPGEVVAYTLKVTNTGEELATEVSVIAELPVHASPVAGSEVADRGVVDMSTGTLIFEPGDLAAGAAAMATYEVTVIDPLPLGAAVLSSQAIAKAFGLGAVVSDDPSSGAAFDPTMLPLTEPGQTRFCLENDFTELDAGWSTTYLGKAEGGGAALDLSSSSRLRLTGEGTGLHHGEDDGVFVHRAVTGDFRIELDIEAIAADGSGKHRRACLMARSGLGSKDAKVSICFLPEHPHGPSLEFDARLASGEPVQAVAEIESGISLPVRLALVRRGDALSVSYSTDGGGEWREPAGALGGLAVLAPEANTGAAADTLEVGPAVAAYDGTSVFAADFDDWRLCKPSDDPGMVKGVASGCDLGLPLDVIYLVDLSESMGTAFPGGAPAVSKIAAASRALDRVHARVAQRQDGSRSALLTFKGSDDPATNLAGVVDVMTPLSTDLEAVRSALDAVDDISVIGSTTRPTGLALEETLAELMATASPGHQTVLILVTDGLPNVDRGGLGYGDDSVAKMRAIPLRGADGAFMPWSQVAWLGSYNGGYGTFDGEPLAGALYGFDRLAQAFPDLMIYGIGLRGVGRGFGSFHLELVDYAAWVTGGLSFSPARKSELEAAVESLLTDLDCEAISHASRDSALQELDSPVQKLPLADGWR